MATPGHSFFHSSAWARVLKDSYGYTPLYFATIKNGQFTTLVPVMEVNSFITGKRGVSLPFTDYCEPIINANVEFVDLFNSLIEYGKKRGWKYVEIRGGDKYLRGQESGIRDQETGGRKQEAGSSNLNPESWNLYPGTFSSNPHSAIRIPQSEGPTPCTDSFSLSPLPLAPCLISYLSHTLSLSKD